VSLSSQNGRPVRAAIFLVLRSTLHAAVNDFACGGGHRALFTDHRCVGVLITVVAALAACASAKGV
jgi:hypothetical protein